MPTSIYDETHDLFRAAVRAFVADEMSPHFHEWEQAGIMDREVYAKAGGHGFVGFNMPESHGGGGSDDFRFNAIVGEELAYAGLGGAGNGIGKRVDLSRVPFVLPSLLNSSFPAAVAGEFPEVIENRCVASSECFDAFFGAGFVAASEVGNVGHATIHVSDGDEALVVGDVRSGSAAEDVVAQSAE